MHLKLTSDECCSFLNNHPSCCSTLLHPPFPSSHFTFHILGRPRCFTVILFTVFFPLSAASFRGSHTRLHRWNTAQTSAEARPSALGPWLHSQTRLLTRKVEKNSLEGSRNHKCEQPCTWVPIITLVMPQSLADEIQSASQPNPELCSAPSSVSALLM